MRTWYSFENKTPQDGKYIAVTNFNGPSMIGFVHYNSKMVPLMIEMYHDAFIQITSFDCMTHWCYISNLIEPLCPCSFLPEY